MQGSEIAECFGAGNGSSDTQSTDTLGDIHRFTWQYQCYLHNDNKTPVEQHLVTPEHGVYGVHIPAGQWHNLEVLESGTVILK